MKKPAKKAGGYKAKKALKSATKKSAVKLPKNTVVEETAKVAVLQPTEFRDYAYSASPEADTGSSVGRTILYGLIAGAIVVGLYFVFFA